MSFATLGRSHVHDRFYNQGTLLHSSPTSNLGVRSTLPDMVAYTTSFMDNEGSNVKELKFGQVVRRDVSLFDPNFQSCNNFQRRAKGTSTRLRISIEMLS